MGRFPLRIWKPFRAKVPVLSMEDYRQELIEIWLRAELSHNTPRHRTTTGHPDRHDLGSG